HDHGGRCAAGRVDRGAAVSRRTTPAASGFGVTRTSRMRFETCRRGGFNMIHIEFSLTRRSALFAAIAFLLPTGTLFADEKEVITVHKDPTCGCCSGWVQHLHDAGFVTKVLDTSDIDAVKKRLGVPDDLAACHPAQLAGFIIERHA